MMADRLIASPTITQTEIVAFACEQRRKAQPGHHRLRRLALGRGQRALPDKAKPGEEDLGHATT
ncbi:hypothetical protein DPM13_15110 [Paracoccus mutanolyticus]|uniref:Uncharacterized protein n=1 Tax=Paracoccus mutanolyticus TaxID=1499308 RepID=A0ABM6WTD0_9RHOB|nr:hypothetical protein DPM13_15110 [Paracoccus mutanolyticus]